MGKQSYLEKKGFEKRDELIVRNDYTKNEEYNATHPDAISDGDPQGKGTGHGGHTHVNPDRNLILTTEDGVSYSKYNYDQLDTENGGGSYDIEGRNGVGGRDYLKAISNFNREKPYGLNYVDTSLNIAEGQYHCE